MKLLPSKYQPAYLISLGQWNYLQGVGLLGLLLAVLLQALLAPAAYAATITVNSLADTQANDSECTLREALINANNDNQSGSTDCMAGSGADTINFSIDGTILLGSALPAISQALIIDGTGQSVIVDGGSAVRVFNATATLTMTNITVQNGNVAGTGAGINGTALVLSSVNVLSNTSTIDGGGVRATAGITLTNGLFRNNRCTASCSGGGVSSGSSNLTITGAQFISNTAGANGGGAHTNALISITDGYFESNRANNGTGGALAQFAGQPVTLDNTTFISNTATNNGGGVAAGGATTISDSLFQANSCTGSSCIGGGLQTSGALSLTDSQFISNSSLSSGGGAYASGVVTLSGGLFQNNVCTGENCSGGGLYGVNAVTMNGTQFISNTSQLYGGGSAVFGVMTVNNVTALSNWSGYVSGGLWGNNLITITNSIFDKNISDHCAGVRGPGVVYVATSAFTNNAANAGNGGAICADGGLTGNALTITGNSAVGTGGGILAFGPTTLSNSNVLSNTSAGNGGGMFVSGAVTVTSGLFQANKCTNGGCNGGGLSAGSTVSLSETSFINNTATNGGGLSHSSGTGRVVNALFARNTASGNGEALYLVSTGSVQLLHTTVASPTLNSGAAIYIANGTVGITNTLVASHTTAIQRAAGVVSENYNLFFGNTTNLNGTITSGGGSLVGAPAFTDPTAGVDDYRLTAASAAINAGVDMGITSDFEGEARPQAGGVDIGYDEAAFTSQAELTLVKTVTPATALPGQTITYTLTFTNSGPQVAQEVRITDSVPAALSGVAYQAGGVTITDTGTVPAFVWQAQNLVPGQSGVITLTGVVNNGLSGGVTFTNTAIIASSATDNDLTDNTGEAAVGVSNSPPVLASLSDQTITETTTLTFTVTATDSNGDTLSYGLSGAPAGATINSSTGLFSWTPTEAQGPGTYIFSLIVTDTGGLTDTTVVMVTVDELSSAPIIATISDQTITETFLLTFTASATDDDIPVQPLTYGLVNEPSGASLNSSTGLFSWTPTEAQGPGVYTFTVIVTDTDSLTGSTTVQVTVNELNTAPFLAAVGEQTITETFMLTFTASATDSDEPPQALTYGLIDGPAGATINSSTGQFSWIPTEAQGPGSYFFSLIVTDTGGLSNTTVVAVTVNEVNSTPTLAAIPNQTGAIAQVLSFTAVANDSDIPTNTLTYSLANAPTGATINATTGLFTWTPASVGLYTVTVMVADDGSPVLTDTIEVVIIVNEPKLSLTKTIQLANPAPGPGAPVIYTVVIANNGDANAVNVVIQDILPAGVTGSNLNQTVSVAAHSSLTFTLNATIADNTGSGVTIINTATFSHTSGSGSASAAFTTSEPPAPSLTTLYLPLIVHGVPPAGPDLVVDSLVATAGALTVTVRNAGDSPVTDAFWLDIYFNPTQTPAVNKEWQAIAPAGVAWGVTESLDPGETLTLVYGGPYFVASESSALPLPVGAQVYALVDSINHATNYGNVPEINEGNNLWGPVISASGQASSLISVAQPVSREDLPER